MADVNMIDPHRYYRIPEILLNLGIARATLYRLKALGKLPSLDKPYGPRVSGYWGRTLLTALIALQTGTVKAPAPDPVVAAALAKLRDRGILPGPPKR